MGSGSSSSYNCSQPYAELYSVISKMLKKDKENTSIYNNEKGYFKNPTATDLMQSIEGNYIYLNKQKANGTFTYVLDKNGKIIFGKRSNPNGSNLRSPHPTLIGGKNPKVQCAGIITFKNGKIDSIDNRSGHYRPNIKSLDKVDNILNELYKSNPNLFWKNSKWRKENDK